MKSEKIKPLVTVAVVCYNEEENIVACLESLLNQSFPSQKYEILIVDNGSTDQTQDLVKPYLKGSKGIRWMINWEKGIASSRNMAVAEAKGTLLAFTDADCVVRPDWLEKLVSGFEKYQAQDPRVAAVGGGNYPPGRSKFSRALSLVLNTYLGSRGSTQARRYLKNRRVPHLSCSNVLFFKSKIKEIGGFDETLGSIIEDEDLTYRLSRKGYCFYYLARTAVAHNLAKSFKDWAKKMFVYGKGRTWFLARHPEKWSLLFLSPIILVLGFPVLLWPYLILISLYSLRLALVNQKPRLWLNLVSLYFATHFFYGLGQIYGFFRKRE